VKELLAIVEKVTTHKVFSRVGEAREGDVAIAYADPHKAKELL
jgi:UDP-glucose 4-epimerase